MKILIVEDDQMIREGVSEYLKEHDYFVIEAKDGSEALAKFNSEIDLVILDIQLPIINGIDVLKKIREKSDLPILMLTAFGDEEYKIEAFTHFADGYIQKPFSLPVLKVRIEALLKKHYATAEHFSYQDVDVDFVNYTAKVKGEIIDMKAKELEVLQYLVNNEGRVLSRSQILDNVWKETDYIPFDRVIDVYIKEIRKKLHLDCIVTIRNVGYKLERK